MAVIVTGSAVTASTPDLAGEAPHIDRPSGPPQRPAHPSQSQRRRNRLTLLALAAVVVLPVLASYLSFHLMPPGNSTQHGELVSSGGPELSLPAALQSRWLLVYVGSQQCDPQCERAHYTLRQAQRAQGDAMHRVRRAWLTTDAASDASDTRTAPKPEPQAAATGAGAAPSWMADVSLHRLAEEGIDLLAWKARLVPPSGETSAIYLIDPLGRPALRYPPDTDPAGVIKDLRHLLKYSALGR